MSSTVISGWQARTFIYVLLTFTCQFAIVSSSSLSSADTETVRYSANCFSCASAAYLSLWSQLMHHYFPPKNFTDRCWEPDSEIGTVPCRGSCFTLVEEIYEHFSTHAVMRGCVDRFLLFGIDEDVRDALADKSECRATDRRLLHLVALTPETDLGKQAAAPTAQAGVPPALAARATTAAAQPAAPQAPATAQDSKKDEEKISSKNEDEKKESKNEEEKNDNEKEKKPSKKEEEKQDGQKVNEKKQEGQAPKEGEKKQEADKPASNPIVTPVSDESDKGTGAPKNANKEGAGKAPSEDAAKTAVDAKKEKILSKTAIHAKNEEKQKQIDRPQATQQDTD